MTSIHAEVKLHGETRRLLPGMVIGRGFAGLHIADPSLSEAHALCSLREDGLVLLPLRGQIRVMGESVARVVLEPGIVVELAEHVSLRVVQIYEAERTLEIHIDGAPIELPTGYGRLDLTRVPTWRNDGDGDGAEVWRAGQDLFIGAPGQLPRRIEAGLSMVLAGHRLDVIVGPRRPRHTRATQRGLTLTVGMDHAEVTAGHDRVAVFEQQQALMLYVLADQPPSMPSMNWEDLARAVWGGRNYTRKKYDNVRARMRVVWEAAGLPALLEQSRRAHVELNRTAYEVR